MNKYNPQLMRSILRKKIDKVNIKCKDQIKQLWDKYPERTSLIVIQTEDGRDLTGFGMADGRLEIMDNIEQPTLIARVSLRLFLNVLAGKISGDQAFYLYGPPDIFVDGENLFEHKLILTEIIDTFQKIAKEGS